MVKNKRGKKVGLFGILGKEKLSSITPVPFANEEEVVKLLHANFSLILPHLVRLTELKEHSIGYGDQEGERPDDIAIDPTAGIIYVIEYKNKLDREALEQVRGYRNALLNELNNRADLRETFLEPKWSKKDIEKWGLWKSKSKDWEKMRAICIAPEFAEKQSNGQDSYLTLIKFTRYGNETLLLESESEEIASQWSKKVKTIISIPSPTEPSISQILSKSSQWVKDKVGAIDKLITKSYPNLLKGRVIYTWEYTYEKEKQKILLITPRRENFTIYLRTNQTLGEPLLQPLLKDKSFIQKFKVDKENDYQQLERLLPDYLEETLGK